MLVLSQSTVEEVWPHALWFVLAEYGRRAFMNKSLISLGCFGGWSGALQGPKWHGGSMLHVILSGT